jgi:hypothetical protein
MSRGRNVSPPVYAQQNGSRREEDELRASVALARAKEQLHRTALKESQKDNKRLRNELKLMEERYEKANKELITVKQSLARHSSSNKSQNGGSPNYRPGDFTSFSTRRNTMGVRLQREVPQPTAPIMATIGIQANIVPPPPAPTPVAKPAVPRASRLSRVSGAKRTKHGRSKASRQSHLGSSGNATIKRRPEYMSSEKLKKINLELENKVKNLESQLILITESTRLFEQTVMAPYFEEVNGGTPTLREIAIAAKHTPEEKIFSKKGRRSVGSSPQTQPPEAAPLSGQLPTMSDLENIVNSFGDLASEIKRLRTYKKLKEKEEMEDDRSSIMSDGVSSLQPNKLQEERYNALMTKIRILERAALQNNQNHEEETSRMNQIIDELSRKNDELSKEMVALHHLQFALDEKQDYALSTMTVEPNIGSMDVVSTLEDLRKECERQLEILISDAGKQKERLADVPKRLSFQVNNKAGQVSKTDEQGTDEVHSGDADSTNELTPVLLTTPERKGGDNDTNLAVSNSGATKPVDINGRAYSKVFMLPAEMSALADAFR